MNQLPPPKPVDPINAEFWKSCQDSVLRFQRCTECNTFRHLPRYMCYKCGSFDYEWAPVTGKGKVYSWTATHQVFHPSFDVPSVSIIVDFPEGIRMVSVMPGVKPEEMALDKEVEVTFKSLNDEFVLPVFKFVN